jgi:hypothetical protein
MANSGQGRKTRRRELVSRSPEETPSATPQHSKIVVAGERISSASEQARRSQKNKRRRSKKGLTMPNTKDARIAELEDALRKLIRAGDSLPLPAKSEGRSSREFFVEGAAPRLKPHATSTFTEKLNAAIDEHINEIADHLLDPVALKNLRGLGKPSRELFVTGANLILQQNGFPAATGEPARRVFA